MQISLNTYKPYTTQYYNIQHKQQNQTTFKSGYGAEEFGLIDNPDLPPRSNAERWKNLAIALKEMTIDQYKYMHDIYPEKKPLLFTPEECQKYRELYYKDTDFEGLQPEEYLPPKPEEKVLTDDDFDSIDYTFDV